MKGIQISKRHDLFLDETSGKVFTDASLFDNQVRSCFLGTRFRCYVNNGEPQCLRLPAQTDRSFCRSISPHKRRFLVLGLSSLKIDLERGGVTF